MFLAFSSVMLGSTLTEDFDYSDGNLVGNGNWVQASNGGGTAIQVSSGAISLGTSGEDAHLPMGFSAPNPGSTYAGFDLMLSAAQAGGDYFFGFSGSNASDIRVRLYAKSSGSGYVLGFLPSTGGSPTYSTTELDFDTPYRIVARYDMVSGSNNNTGLFYVNPSDVNTEGNNTAGVSLVSFSSGLEYSGGFAGIMLRQGSSGSSPTISSLDNLVVSTDFSDAAGNDWWSSVTPLISEDFASSAANFTAISGGTWGVSSGRYVLSNPASSSTAGVLGNISVHDTSLTGDFELSATMQITGTSSSWNDAAVIFNYQDEDNYYYVSLNESNDGNTKGIFKVVSGSPTQLADITISVTSDMDYPIEIVRSGSSIAVSVNSSQVASASDATFTSGKVGFGSYNDGAQFDDLVVTGTSGGADTQAPSVPTGLTSSNITTTSVDLDWNASSDNVGVTGYKIYIDGSNPQSVTSTSVTVTNLDPNTSYTFSVSSYDGANNESSQSSGVNVTTAMEQVTAPQFSLSSGTYTSAQNVTITSSTSGATIRYTTDGSTPTSTSGTIYSGAVSISSTATLKAIAFKSGMIDSSVTSATYTINIPSGTILDATDGFYNLALSSSQTGTFTAQFSATPDSSSMDVAMGLSPDSASAYSDIAVIVRFNPSGNIDARDGGSYSADSTISYSADTTYHFRLVVNVSAHTYSAYVTPDGGSEVTIGSDYDFRSDQSSATYLDYQTAVVESSSSGQVEVTAVTISGASQQVAAPQFSPGGGTYGSTQNVSITTSTSGATIRYTTDGSTPTSTSGTIYSSAISISSTTTLKAIAYKSGVTDSSVTSATYTIIAGTVAAPQFSPGGGVYSSTQSVTMSTSTSGATIRYTTDGSTPTSSTGTIYSGAISVSATTTLKAIAYKSGMSDSSVTSASYTISSGSTSFGPDGTHWPDSIETPYMYDSGVENIVEVACSWSAISSAISSVTSTEAAEGMLILVQPGTLVGNGNGSTSTPVLQNLGSASWSKRITVAPRDGWGSVVISPGARIYKVQSVCFAGFDFAGLAFHANHRSALAWCRVSGFLSMNGASGETISNVDIVEVVIPDSAVTGGDSADCFTGGANEVSNFNFVGCYIAPRYRPSGSSAHTDTLQFEPTSGGSDVTDVYMKDCVFFASTNCALQVNAIDGLIMDHCYIAGGATAKTRYPFTSGADTAGANNCFNGGGINMEAYDSYFIGGISGSAGSWIYAENTRTTYGGTNVPSSGSWIVDNTLDEDNPTMPPYPTTSYLDSIWNP